MHTAYICGRQQPPHLGSLVTLLRATVAILFNGGVAPLLVRAINHSINSLRDLELSALFFFSLSLPLILSSFGRLLNFCIFQSILCPFGHPLTMGQRHQLFVIAKIGTRYRGLAAVHHRKSFLHIYSTRLCPVCNHLLTISQNGCMDTQPLKHVSTLKRFSGALPIDGPSSMS